MLRSITFFIEFEPPCCLSHLVTCMCVLLLSQNIEMFALLYTSPSIPHLTPHPSPLAFFCFSLYRKDEFERPAAPYKRSGKPTPIPLIAVYTPDTPYTPCTPHTPYTPYSLYLLHPLPPSHPLTPLLSPTHPPTTAQYGPRRHLPNRPRYLLRDRRPYPSGRRPRCRCALLGGSWSTYDCLYRRGRHARGHHTTQLLLRLGSLC